MYLAEQTTQSIDHALSALSNYPGLIAFDSAKLGATGQWSFVSADPVATINVATVDHEANSEAETDWVRKARQWHAAVTNDSEIPFAGGLAGVLSYDLRHCYEQLDRPQHDEFALPTVSIGVYDWCLAWNHDSGRCVLLSTGLDANGTVTENRARDRANDVLAALRETPESPAYPRQRSFEITAPRHSVPAFPGIVSNFSPADFRTAVERVREHIAAGDIFQANLAQRLLAPQTESPLVTYQRLRSVNPAPFAGYFDAGSYQLLSASPERFLEVTPAGDVETRPIKGTRRRKTGIEADLYTRDELRESDKDVAENVMIVDLLRNDLSRVCDPHSIHVPQLCEIETYETVQHLVSSVRGRLKPENDVWDLVAATFPGGSITGCPKIRAMDVITSIEQVARGPYCGSMFYHSFNGRFDSSILIRTLIVAGGWCQMSVGGGITYASDPADEYQETIDKAVALVRALPNGHP